MAKKFTATNGTFSAVCIEKRNSLDCDVYSGEYASLFTKLFDVSQRCKGRKYKGIASPSMRKQMKEQFDNVKSMIARGVHDVLNICDVKKEGKTWIVSPKTHEPETVKICKDMKKVLNATRMPFIMTKTRRSCNTSTGVLSPDAKKVAEAKQFFNDTVIPKTDRDWLWSELS